MRYARWIYEYVLVEMLVTCLEIPSRKKVHFTSRLCARHVASAIKLNSTTVPPDSFEAADVLYLCRIVKVAVVALVLSAGLSLNTSRAQLVSLFAPLFTSLERAFFLAYFGSMVSL